MSFGEFCKLWAITKKEQAQFKKWLDSENATMSLVNWQRLWQQFKSQQ